MQLDDMPEQFFIAGMPRCRTAWFAEYLSHYPGVECHHELLNGLTDRQQFYEAMERPGCVGNSDSGLFITDFQERWPDAPTLILLRDPKEVYESLKRLLGVDPSMELIQKQYDAAQDLRGMVVFYEDIDESMPLIHEYLRIPYSAEIHAQFIHKNVQLTELKVCLESYRIWGLEEVA